MQLLRPLEVVFFFLSFLEFLFFGSSCGSGGRAVVHSTEGHGWVLAPLSACSKCPWANHRTPNCSIGVRACAGMGVCRWCAVGILHGSLCHRWLNGWIGTCVVKRKKSAALTQEFNHQSRTCSVWNYDELRVFLNGEFFIIKHVNWHSSLFRW